MLVMTQRSFGSPPPSDFNVYPTKAQVEEFRENGFIVVDRITTDEEIDWLLSIYDYIFDPARAGEPGSPVDRSGAQDDAGANKLQQSFFPEAQHPGILETTFRRNAKRFAAALLGVEEAAVTSWGHMIKKWPGGRAAPWHQDHAYWDPELDYHALGVWLPMHDVSVEMGAMQFIPGSHKLGLLQHKHTERPQDNLLLVDDPRVDLSTAVPCPLKKGGATFHHSETLHHTAPNTTDRPRLAFPMEFQTQPVWRDTPDVMPWVEERRAVTGKGPIVWAADGKISRLERA